MKKNKSGRRLEDRDESMLPRMKKMYVVSEKKSREEQHKPREEQHKTREE